MQTPAVDQTDRAGVRLWDLFRLLRPKQWSKNLLVFAAILFTGHLSDPRFLAPVLLTFAALCLAGSGIYVLNDLLDIERDRHHPRKQHRPLASGSVPIWLAIGLIPMLLGSALGIAFAANIWTLGCLLSYVALQVLYNLGLKRVAVADVFVISVGFIFRAVAGAAAINVSISGWLLFCTGALALMLGFGKRRQEFISQGEERGLSRESLTEYTRSALDALVVLSAGSAALCYGVYAVESETAHKYPALILTSAFVFYGISRYVLLVFSKDEGSEPETLLFSDRHILLSVLLFLVSALLALSGLHIPMLEAK